MSGLRKREFESVELTLAYTSQASRFRMSSYTLNLF